MWALTRVVDFGPSIAGLLTLFLIGTPVEAKDFLGRLFDFRVGGRCYAWTYLLLES